MIKHCPFCNGKATLGDDCSPKTRRYWSVICDNCGAEGGKRWSAKKARKVWNARSKA